MADSLASLKALALAADDSGEHWTGQRSINAFHEAANPAVVLKLIEVVEAGLARKEASIALQRMYEERKPDYLHTGQSSVELAQSRHVGHLIAVENGALAALDALFTEGASE